VQWYVGVFLHENWDEALAFAERTKLLGSANIGNVGARSEKSQNYLGRIKCSLDFCGPTRSSAKALAVKPYVQATRFQALLEAEGQVLSIAVCIGDEKAAMRVRRHWITTLL
jgi:hypothetical protein